MSTANIKAVITAEDKASKTVQGVGLSFSKMASAVGVGTIVAQGFQKALDMVVNAGKDAVKQAANFEQTRTGLENMLGSADKARALLGDISKFAAETPFEFPELAQSVRQLVAFGFGAEDAFSTMKQLGDVSAAVGAPINDLAYLMGTLKTQGRAFTIDIRQFAQRGIPIYEYLAKVLHTNEQEISNMIEAGKIGFPEVQKAFEAMTGEGGKFHGTMAKQSKTLNGLMSTLKDNLGQVARGLVGITDEGEVVAGSIFDRLRKGVAYLIENLPSMIGKLKEFGEIIGGIVKDAFNGLKDAIEFLTPSFQALWETLTLQVWPVLQRLWKEVIEPLIPVFATLLVGALKLTIDAFNKLLETLTPVINFLIDNKEYVLGFAAAFGVLWATMKAQDAINAFIVGMNVIKLVTIPSLMTSLSGLNSYLTAFGGFGVFAGLAVGALAVVISKYNEMNEVIRRTNEKVANAEKSIDGGQKRINEQFKEGKISADKYKEHLAQRAKEANDAVARETQKSRELQGVGGFFKWISGRAIGGPVTAQTPYVVGEKGPELFVPRQSGNIIPNNKINQASSSGSLLSSGNVSINVNVGMYAGSEIEKRKVAESLFQALQDLASSRNTSVGKMMGA